MKKILMACLLLSWGVVTQAFAQQAGNDTLTVAVGEHSLGASNRVTATEERDFVEQANWDYNYMKGDINNDGRVTICDVTREVRDLLAAKAGTGRLENRHKVENELPGEEDVEAIAKIVAGIDAPSYVNELWRFTRLSGTLCADQTGGYLDEDATLTGLVDDEDYTSLMDTLAPGHLTVLHFTTGIAGVVGVSAYAKGKEKIAGPLTVDNRDGQLCNLATSAGARQRFTTSQESDVVRLAQGGTDFTLYLRPVALPSGLTLTLQTEAGKFYSYDVPSVAEGALNSLGEITADDAQDKGAWMATLPGNLNFTSISIPGAHDAATYNITSGLYASARCQSLTLAQQLRAGVRGFDLRPRYDGGNMTIYHTVTTGIKLSAALGDIAAYLGENPSETVFVMIKEDSGTTTADWSNGVTACLNDVKDCIKVFDTASNLDGNVLDNCRGKMVVLTRDDIAETNLALKTGWGSNSGYDKPLTYARSGGTATGLKLHYQDEYEATTDGEARVKYMTDFLASYIPKDGDRYTLTINTSNSAESNWLGIPKSPSGWAGSINSAVVNSDKFKSCSTRFGIMMFDFIGDPDYNGDRVLDFVIGQNHKYAFEGLGK